MLCTYEPRNRCGGEAVINFDFCVDHLNTPRGAQHMIDRVRTRRVVTESDVERTIEQKSAIPDKDYQTTALEKMNEALDRVLAFERHTHQLVSVLDPMDWRYVDRTGGEQLRSEVSLYERAMDRTARTLKDVSKMAIQDKIVSLGKAQTELMVRILMAVVSDMNLSDHQIEEAKKILLKKFIEEGNLASRTRYEVTRQLESVDGEVVEGETI